MKQIIKLRQLSKKLRRILRDRLDRDGKWFAWAKLRAHVAVIAAEEYGGRDLLTKKFRLEVLREAQHFLAPLAPNECRGRVVWRNLYFCPKQSPIGDYIWHFQAWIVHEILTLHPEFISGFKYALGRCRKGRDGNPFGFMDCDRAQSWDSGLILGLNWHRVVEWSLTLKG